MQGEGPEAADYGSLGEALGQTEVEQPRRSRVEPARTDAHDVPDIPDGLDQGRRQLDYGVVLAGLHGGDDVQVAGGAIEKAEEQQAAAADGHQLIAQTSGLEGLGECLQCTQDGEHAGIIPA